MTAPGPTGGDMLRAFGQIRGDALGFLEESWRRHGDVVQFPIPTPPTYLVTHPDYVRQVLQGNHRGYGKDTIQYRNLALVTGNGLLAADTEPWRRQRKAVQPAFRPSALAQVGAHAAAAAARLADRWGQLPDGAIIDVEHDMMTCALEIVGAALFGSDWQDEAGDLVAATQEGLRAVVARTRNPLAAPLRVPTPGNRRLRSAVARLDRQVAQVVAARRAAPAAELAARQPDMLDVLLTGGMLSPREVRDQVVTFIVAGHETVASALTWCWYLLGEHPWAADALAAEARRQPGSGDAQGLPWATAVFDESLRLYPPGWLITRQAVAPDDLGGHRIPAGALVLISPYLVHRHPAAVPDQWQEWERGADPEAFDPERFQAHPPASVNGTYIPFGAGPRLCIGREMARVEGAVVLAGLAREFRLEPVAGRPVGRNPMVMLKPKPELLMRVRRRGTDTSDGTRPD